MKLILHVSQSIGILHLDKVICNNMEVTMTVIRLLNLLAS